MKLLQFYHEMDDRIFLLKLIPSIDPLVLENLADSYDGLILESFGVGGLPDYGNHDFAAMIEKWTSAGKLVTMSTQVTHEGSDMGIYKVGKTIKENFEILESYDMTLKATVTKMMWILAQTRDFSECKKLFYTTINKDILF